VKPRKACSSFASLLVLVSASVGTASAWGADRTVAPSARTAGVALHPGEASGGDTARAVPLRVPSRAAYAQAKRRADSRFRRLAPRPAPQSGAVQRSRPLALVSGSLNLPGLNAEEQVETPEGASTPPDTTGAIGPTDYVEFVNSEVRAYARSTLTPAGPAVSLTEFVGGKAVCDPQIKYDPQGERWFYAAIRCDGTKAANELYVGFSKTSDPTDFSIATGHGWCGYAYNTGKALEDYPKLGLDPSHILIGTNSFSAVSEAFLTSHILSFPKPTGTITTCPTAPTMTTFGSEGSPLRTLVSNHEAFTPEPATVAGEASAGYVVSADFGLEFGSGENIMIWQVAGTAGAPELKQIAAPTVAAYELPPGVPQPGTIDEIDSLDARLTQAVAADDPNAGGEEAVWTQHTISGGAGSVVRWYELLPAKGQVRQSGTISDPSKFVFNAAIAPTLNGDAVINYNTGSSEALVQTMAQSRIGSAPLGTMNGPVELGTSVAVDSDFSCPTEPLGEEIGADTCRWGDYAGASVDPIDPNLVWGSNQANGPIGSELEFEEEEEIFELGHNPQWITRNFALEANDIAPSASFTASPNPTTPGSSVSFDASGSSDPDGTIASYSWDFGDGSAAGSGVAPSHAYAAAGSYQVTLTVTDNGGETGSVSHTVKVSVPTVEFPLSVAKTGTGKGQVVSTPTGIECGTTCNAEFAEGTEVTLTATPEAGSSFSGWAGACSGTGQCKVTVEEALEVRAEFTANPSGAGTGGTGTGGTTSGTGVSTGTSTSALATAVIAPVPNSNFTATATLNARTGAIVFTISALESGKLSWLATFPNGRFGAFTSSTKCKKGQLKLGARCLPAKIVFAKGSKTVGAPGRVSVTLKPSPSGLKALKRALKQHKGVPVTIVLTFQSSLGGRPVSHSQAVIVKLKK